MAKQYTAKEMREAACRLVGEIEVNSPVADSVIDRASEMLRQAADMMEREYREKKYEYATKWDDGKIDGISLCKDEVIDSISFVQYISSISADDQTGCKLVRREVGEWEEVK